MYNNFITYSMLFFLLYNLLCGKKSNIFIKKGKKFIDFTLDMYLTYGDSLDIIPKEHHDVIINELKKLREKYFKKEE